ncbi:hypothetical protein EPO04_01470 [Patescibacteria group bacterium]|nr:MAG: hypothetical protein EPO04_01470 [Patescibacteria group bacterium]
MFTNPYGWGSIVQQPYTTKVENGQITFHQNFTIKVYGGPVADLLGYYKSGLLIVQNSLFGSQPVPGSSAEEITSSIHWLRFDPSKPYLISGDQFSVLYVRNLGVFYNQLLNPNIALSQDDWQNKQRVYLQSVLYGIDGLSAARTPKTTVVPIGPRSAALTQVHPGSYGSDSVYGLLYGLDQLQNEKTSADGKYHQQTRGAAEQIIRERQPQLQQIVNDYLNTVQDPQTGLVKNNLKLASARDGVTRSSSFYDNVVMWKTLELANKLDIRTTNTQELTSLHQRILNTYWSQQTGCFIDSIDNRLSYSSDWLIALPIEFLLPTQDKDRLQSCVSYIRKHKLAEPFPIKYNNESKPEGPWAVRTFVPNYGGNAIWSYWGAEYITLLANLNKTTNDPSYRQEAERHINTYHQKMVEYHGFPETFDANGNFLQNAVYKSIRSTGWVVQLEYAEWLLSQP